ncbi:acyl-ACP--UDP-N-acetylglucosamine O-acyltransferase [Oharaeibacter diazotrophicus]|uniref:Acyl-[acyl-carrier-protein]--UDP-N-acetylglucosamine O-acyltransferase n=1 Tax=Oharaeibacter diazotrophicus TaxID=1920512 RepID=A0A4R6RLF3_9HYPH|nr:acyl-ACP--UDP-N-acetylglucosamine O-acyltransferase [Oharaeibacter diazotrophicus]TDP87489.1 acyl-[acyl-carrier-protein]--UDP-N-acetylglucosamine O-acyltransferase [Oharaeibacter diazotrophicus]BBE70567.1 acyl-[acyl-carrier-protein]-UDP-N-acetylglucosamine O-acyltransferase [Pleomorphomonas sp. SM30]GLS77313.1 acyl-[acyl-carrier-protein]--UDP-N-acetylglucosamine O-acyltransferase [Oharaeibacter diazotrophicus]
MSSIHPSAIVDGAAEIGIGVSVGPFAVIGPDVRLGDGVVVHSHAVIGGRTTIGAAAEIFPYAAVGMVPQDLKYRGEPSRLEIGARTVIRENATIHLGTEGGGMLTSIGAGCLIMVGAHVAHDCRIGDNVILVNNATLAGHVQIADNAILGGLSAVHQWVRIGEGAFVGGMAGVENDVIPFGTVIGNRARLGGLNLVGLRRAGHAREDVHALRGAYKALFEGEEALAARVDRVAAEFGGSPLVDKVIAFIRAGGDRAITTPRERSGED